MPFRLARPFTWATPLALGLNITSTLFLARQSCGDRRPVEITPKAFEDKGAAQKKRQQTEGTAIPHIKRRSRAERKSLLSFFQPIIFDAT